MGCNCTLVAFIYHPAQHISISGKGYLDVSIQYPDLDNKGKPGFVQIHSQLMIRVVVISLFVFALVSCKQEIDPTEPVILTIPGGKHGAISVSKRIGAIDGTYLERIIVLDQMTPYDWTGQPYALDQYDVNKLGGYRFHWLDRHYLTAMEGFRWDLQKKAWRINLYNHGQVSGTLNYEKIHCKEHGENCNTWSSYNAVFAQEGDTVTVRRWIFPDEGRIYTELSVGEQQIVEDAQFKTELKQKPREIWPWFGGQQVAPEPEPTEEPWTRSAYNFIWYRIYD